MSKETDSSVKTKKPSNKPKALPPYKVLLLDDNVNEFGQVVLAVEQLTPLTHDESVTRVTEAHKTGVALLLVTHKERAELYQEQFQSHIPPIKVSIEPDEK